MSLESARAMRDSLQDPSGYCFPLSVDCLLKQRELPMEFYDSFKAAVDDPYSSKNAIMTDLIQGFFGIQPNPETDMAPVAKYNAYGASVQPYCPDVLYDYSEVLPETLDATDVTNKNLRLKSLLRQATDLRCLVIFNLVNDFGHHARAIDVVDPGGINGRAGYIIREITYPVNKKIYDIDEISGVAKGLGGYSDEFAPLPEVARPRYPGDGTSWELTILPPEPR